MCQRSPVFVELSRQPTWSCSATRRNKTQRSLVERYRPRRVADIVEPAAPGDRNRETRPPVRCFILALRGIHLTGLRSTARTTEPRRSGQDQPHHADSVGQLVDLRRSAYMNTPVGPYGVATRSADFPGRGDRAEMANTGKDCGRPCGPGRGSGGHGGGPGARHRG